VLFRDTLPQWNKCGRIFKCNNDEFFKSHTTRPIPYLLNNKILRIYFSSRDVNDIPYPTFIDVDPLNPSKVLFVNSTPMMALGGPGMFDDSGITPVSILRDGSEVLMYYVGWKRRRYGVTIETSIGVARIVDSGKKLERIFDGPILAQDKYHPFLVAAPYVVKEDDAYRMWYCSATKWKNQNDGLEMIYTVYQLKSNNKYDWHKPHFSEPVIQYKYDGEVISAPWVERTLDGYIMWYSYRGSKTKIEKRYKIGCATSKCGLKWTRSDEYAGIFKSDKGWDSEMICYPSIINMNDNTYMFYSGNDVGRGGIGYAISENMLKVKGFSNE
jgi:hypothetical protein